jgi:hypothetical protein
MDIICGFEGVYSIQSFFRDLSVIRQRTFTVKTIKHAFKKAGMGPISFKATQEIIRLYGKRKTTGLDKLEYGDNSDNSSDTKIDLEQPKSNIQP